MIIKPNLQTVKSVVKYGVGIFMVLLPLTTESKKENETKADTKNKK